MFEVLISKVLPNRDRKGVGMGLRPTKGDEDASWRTHPRM